MSRFSVGEIAAHVGGYGWRAGEQVQISHVGPFKKGDRVVSANTGRHVRVGAEAQYVIIGLEEKNTVGLADDCDLRKLPGDSIPESTRTIFTKKQRNPDDVPLTA